MKLQKLTPIAKLGEFLHDDFSLEEMKLSCCYSVLHVKRHVTLIEPQVCRLL